ncbi:MAG: curli production assembly protein CsgG [Herminiimonas sp.]|nr:curli production assembly protein CsgG [Herminiimonas sp.]
MNRLLVSALVLASLTGCAVTAPPQVAVEAPASRAQQAQAQRQATLPEAKTFKRKIAIGRFTNETRYGRTFQVDSSTDPLGKQASDMLMTRLVASNKFLVFERQDLGKIEKEQAILGQSNLIGVDALILGSVTEFGRSTTGKSGFLSSTKLQTARAKVEIRLADARTGHVFFTATGVGEVSTETGQVAGFGNRADYDGTLNDQAIGAAISDVQNALVAKLEERPWRTDILKTEGNRLYISGGARQGLKTGDSLLIMRAGESIKSAQSGFAIALPPTQVGTGRIAALFGDDETNEGSIVDLLSGSAIGNSLFVTDAKVK